MDGSHNSDGNNSTELPHKCAIDLCGTPKESKLSALLDFNFDQYVQEDLMKRFSEIENELKEIIESEFSKNDKFIKALQEKLEKGPLTLDYSKWKKWDYSNYTWRFFDEYIEFQSDKSKPFNERLSYKIELPKNVSGVFKAGIEQYAKNKKKKIEESFSSGLYQDFYKIEEAKKIIVEKWDEFYKKYQSNKKDKPNFMKDRESDIQKLREKIEKGDLKDLYVIENFALDLIFLQKKLVHLETGIWPSSNFFYLCSEEPCQKAIEGEIGKYNFKDLTDQLEERNKEKEQKMKEKLSYCKSQFALKALKDYEKSEFEKLIPVVKKALMNNVLSGYSEISRKTFSKYLSDELKLSTKGKK